MGKKQGLLKRQEAKKNRKAQKRKAIKMQARPNDLPANYTDQIDQLTAMAMSIIYDESAEIEKKQLPDAYANAKRTVQYQDDAGPTAIADVALWVLDTVETHLAQRGKTVKPVIILGALGKIAAEVAEAAQTAKVFDLTEEDVQVGIAAALNKYIPQAKKEGKVTDQQVNEAAAALKKKYPKEAEAFSQMIQARNQRQQQGGVFREAPAESSQKPPSKPSQGLSRPFSQKAIQPPSTATPPQGGGLLKGGQNV